jgi:hypothetical protein
MALSLANLLTCAFLTQPPQESSGEHMPSYGARQTEQPAWQKASFCASGECVEIAQQNGMIVLRDSKDPRGSMLHYTSEEWQSFVRGIKAGEFDHFG